MKKTARLVNLFILRKILIMIRKIMKLSQLLLVMKINKNILIKLIIKAQNLLNRVEKIRKTISKKIQKLIQLNIQKFYVKNQIYKNEID